MVLIYLDFKVISHFHGTDYVNGNYTFAGTPTLTQATAWSSEHTAPLIPRGIPNLAQGNYAMV